MARQSIGGTRRHVIIPQQQDKVLGALSRKTGLTISEHVRRAVDAYLRMLALRAKQDRERVS